MTQVIKLSDKAADRIKEILSEKIDMTGVRIGVKSGGCSGNTYDATLDDTMNEVDEVYYSEDKIRIVSDKICSVYLSLALSLSVSSILNKK